VFTGIYFLGHLGMLPKEANFQGLFF